MTIPRAVQTRITAIDAELSLRTGAIETAQESYRSRSGKYAQQLPAKRNQLPPKRGDIPTWEETGLDRVIPDDPALELTVSQYQNVDDGPGWEMVRSLTVNGREYRKITQRGPDIWREQDWFEAEVAG